MIEVTEVLQYIPYISLTYQIGLILLQWIPVCQAQKIRSTSEDPVKLIYCYSSLCIGTSQLTVGTCQQNSRKGLDFVLLWLRRDSSLIPLFTLPPDSALSSPTLYHFFSPLTV